MNLLRVLDNPMTDVAMAVVLLSPVYGFTPEDLAMLKVSGDGRRIYQQMQSLTEQENSDLSRKCGEFLRQISEMRSLSDAMPLEKFIYEVYDMTDLMSLQSLWEHADDRREHLEIFAQYAQTYRENADLTAQSSLSGWLRYLDRLEAGGRKLEIKPGAGVQGSVRIKTIHRSKGLEFPFVFAAKLGTPFSKKPSQAAFQAATDGMLGLRLLDRETCIRSATPSYWYLLDDVYRRQTSEELRLLYVALTRAEQQLFLVTDHPEGAKSNATAAGKLGTLLELDPKLTELLAPCAGCMQDA